jgi:dTDP-4-dehydrorhamnose reductase
MRYLITGKNGQLAQAFIRRFKKEGVEYQAPEESQLDITNASAVDQAVASWKPDVVINCAAYNLVDKAEQDRDRVFAVNAAGPGHLARAASRQKATIVHYGSDYVFDGRKENGLYTEDDAVNPLNEYGRSKLAGEDAVASANARHLILRLSWVFGAGTQNFIFKLAQWAEKNEYLKVACDEFSVPTFTGTVVDVTLQSLKQGVTGRFHLTNSGYCSRYEWARVVFAARGINKFIRPVTMESFGLPAKRPGFSAMNNGAIIKAAGCSIPAWDDAVRTFLQENQQL